MNRFSFDFHVCSRRELMAIVVNLSALLTGHSASLQGLEIWMQTHSNVPDKRYLTNVSEFLQGANFGRWPKYHPDMLTRL